MKCSLGISDFLEEISSLSHSIVFFYFFALITEEGFLISPCYSLELCIQMLMSFLFFFTFHFSSFHSYLYGLLNNHFAFLHFFFLRMVLITASYTILWISVHSSLSTVLIDSDRHCLSDLILWIYLSLPLIILEWLSGFPTFFNLSLNLAIRSSRSEPQSAPVLFLLTI